MGTPTSDPAPVVAAPAGRRAGGYRLEVISVVAVVVVGVILRFATTSPLWLDEALSVNIAALALGDIPDALRHDGHPPLYYLLLHGWMALFGDGDMAVRALSGLFGVLALPLMWLAARRAAGPCAGWAALVLLAVSPFAIRYSTEARMYSLVMVLVLAGYLVLRRALRQPRPVWLATLTVLTGLALLTHYWVLWLVGAVLAVMSTRVWTYRRTPARRRAPLLVAGAVAGGGILLVPWLGVMAYQSAHTGTPWAGPARPTQVVQSSLADFGFTGVGSGAAEGTLVAVALSVLFLVGLCARRLDEHRLELDVRTVPGVRGEAGVVGLTVALGTMAGYATSTTFAPRYAASFFPLFLVVAAVGASMLPARFSRNLVVGGVAGLCLVAASFNVTTARTQGEELAEAIAEGASPDDVVAFCPDQLGPAVERGLPDGLTTAVYPTLAPAERVDWADYAPRHAEAEPEAFAAALDERADDATIWLVARGGYRTLEGQCEQVVAELGALRPGAAQPVSEDAGVFEHASLFRYPSSSER